MKDKHRSLRKILLMMTVVAVFALCVLLVFCLSPIPVFRLS